MGERLTLEERRLLLKVLRRVDEQAWGTAVGLACGLGLFLATNLLVLEGGQPLGPTLGLLRYFLPGYSVSFGGSLFGFVYGFVLGYGVGRTIGALFSRLIARLQGDR